MPLPPDPLGQALGMFVNDTVQGVTRSIAHYHALPPIRKSLFRASVGAGLVVGSIDIAIMLNDRAVALASAFFSAPSSAPAAVWVPLAVWGFCFAFGLLWFLIGMRVAGVAPDLMRALYSALLCAAFVALLTRGMYPSPALRLPLHPLYLANIAGWGVRCFLSLPIGGNALRRILQHIKRRAGELLPARPRAF